MTIFQDRVITVAGRKTLALVHDSIRKGINLVPAFHVVVVVVVEVVEFSQASNRLLLRPSLLRTFQLEMAIQEVIFLRQVAEHMTHSWNRQ